MDPILKALVEKVSPPFAKKIEDGEKLYAAIAAALTQEQQIALSDKVFTRSGQLDAVPFINWVRTDAGTTAVRAMADAFIGEKS